MSTSNAFLEFLIKSSFAYDNNVKSRLHSDDLKTTSKKLIETVAGKIALQMWTLQCKK